MPWESKTVEELRREFVLAAKQSKNFSALCREFHITRKTGYKWLKRYKQNESLSDRPHCVKVVSNITPIHVEEKITALRKENPGWGAKTIQRVLINEGNSDIPCVKTVNNILSRNGFISPEESLKHRAFIRFEKDHCNEMWQTDFKGEFLTKNNKYCYPLTILDDHSRYSIKIKRIIYIIFYNRTGPAD